MFKDFVFKLKQLKYTIKNGKVITNKMHAIEDGWAR